MTPEKYIVKAAHASRSARLLLEAGENEGACNRAYYAMFNAAHAALLWSGAHINPAETKKHNSLIAAFGRHLVLQGLYQVNWENRLTELKVSEFWLTTPGKKSNSKKRQRLWSLAGCL